MQWGMLRISRRRIPTRVAREAVANSMVHRYYTARGATAGVIADELFTVRSPGEVARGVTLENLIEAFQPRPRAGVDAFELAGIVERSGWSVVLTYRKMLRLGRFCSLFVRGVVRCRTGAIPVLVRPRPARPPGRCGVAR